jgi:hypothetical protein
MSGPGKTIAIVGGVVSALAGLAWLGFKSAPRSVRPPEAPGPDLGTVELPPNLPEPVRRYFEVTSGAQVPVVKTAVFWGTARLKLGLWMPARFRVYHVAGRHFVRYIDMTWFGRTIFTVRDEYVGGKGATVLPGNKRIEGEQVDQGANLIIWAEGLMMPSLLAADPRIRWEPVNDVTARLIVPLDEGHDEMTVHFDPQTGLISQMQAMRYRTPTGPKEPWHGDDLDWQPFAQGLFPSRFAITWENDGSPWSYWNIEGMEWNVDVSAHIGGAD